MASAANAGEIKARMTLELSDFEKKTQKAKEDINSLQQTGKKLVDEGFNKVKQAATLAGLAISGGFAWAVKTGMDFEAQMSRVAAISGATGDQLNELTAVAMRLGSETPKSASEVAKGMELMAAAGFKVNDIIAAMPGVISASVASGEDMARVTEVMTSALNAFHLKASDASKVADVLAQAANDSAADINDMGYAFKYAAPIAYQLGYSIEDLSAAIEIMSNNGIKGEQAGTTLRMGLLRLAAPTKAAKKVMDEYGISIKDAHGKMLPLGQIIDNLRTHLSGLSDSQKAAALQTIFGTEALSGMMTLVNAAPGQFQELKQSLVDSAGASAQMAQQMQNNLKGAVEQLGGAAETAAIQFYNGLSPALKDVVVRLTDFLNSLSQTGAFQRFGQELGKLIEFLASGEGRFILTASAIALVGSKIVSMLPTVGELTIAIRGLWASLTAGELALGPAGWLVAGLSLVGGLMAATAGNVREYTGVTVQSVKSTLSQISAQNKLIDSFTELQRKSNLTTAEFGRYLDLQTRLKTETDPSKQRQLANEMANLQKKSGLSNAELKRMVDLNAKIVQTMPQAATTVTQYGNKIASAAEQVRKMNDEQRKMTELKLWTQVANGVANVAQWEKEAANYAKQYNEASAKAMKAQQDLAKITPQVTAAENALAEARKTGNGAAIRNAEQYLLKLQLQKKEIEDQLNDATSIADANYKSLQASNAKISSLKSQQALLKEIVFQEHGITQENMKNIPALQKQIDLNNIQIAKLLLAKDAHRGNAKEIDAQISKLTSQNQKYQDAINKIRQIDGNQQAVGKTISSNTSKANSMNAALNKSTKKPVDSSQIDSANKKASGLNSNLGKPVTKHVSVFTEIYETVKSIFTGKSHHGGVIKRHGGGPVPGGGIVPGREEVLARLMGGEMVLTQHQQAKLWALINEATTFATRSHESEEADIGKHRIELHTTVELDGRVLGKSIDEIMYTRESTKLRAKGINGKRRAF